MRKLILLMTIALLLVVGCVGKEIVPSLDFQKKIFLSQHTNSVKILDTYAKQLRAIISGLHVIARQEAITGLTDAEGRANVAGLMQAVTKLDSERDADLANLDKKKAEFKAALELDRASFLAIDAKVKELIAKAGELSVAEMNKALEELLAIYLSFTEGRVDG